MGKAHTSARKRVNITLSEDTLKLLDRITTPGLRSRLIDQAVRSYVKERGLANLRKALKEGALRQAERDTRIAEEWFALDEEAWGKSQE